LLWLTHPPQNVRPDDVAAPIVRGTITEVSRTKNGLPREDGPTFTIQWDDGLLESEIDVNEMNKIVKVDPKQLGGRTVLSDGMPKFLEEVGKIMGESMDHINKVNALDQLRGLTTDTNTTVLDIYEDAMRAVRDSVMTAAKIEVWEISGEPKQKDRRITSIAKLDSNQNVKTTTQQRYLRHLTDHNLKLFHDAIANNQSHIDTGDAVHRRQTWANADRELFPKSPLKRVGSDLSVAPKAQITHRSSDSPPRRLKHAETAPSSDMENQVSNIKKQLHTHAHAVPIPAFEMMDNEHVIVAPFFDVHFKVGSDDNLVEIGATPNSWFALVVTRSEMGATWTGDKEFVDALSNEMGTAVECVRFREKRREERKQSLARIKQLCSRWRRVLPINLLQWTVDEMSSSLRKADIYLSMLEPGGQDAKYVATSKFSNMKNLVLPQNKGVTFKSLDSTVVVTMEKPKPNVEPHVLAVGVDVDVKYGKLFFRAVVIRNLGFDCYDVLYDVTKRKVTPPPLLPPSFPI